MRKTVQPAAVYGLGLALLLLHWYSFWPPIVVASMIAAVSHVPVSLLLIAWRRFGQSKVTATADSSWIKSSRMFPPLTACGVGLLELGNLTSNMTCMFVGISFMLMAVELACLNRKHWRRRFH